MCRSMYVALKQMKGIEYLMAGRPFEEESAGKARPCCTQIM